MVVVVVVVVVLATLIEAVSCSVPVPTITWQHEYLEIVRVAQLRGKTTEPIVMPRAIGNSTLASVTSAVTNDSQGLGYLLRG